MSTRDESSFRRRKSKRLRNPPDDRYNYVTYHSYDSYDDGWWWIFFVVIGFFVLLFVIAAIAGYHGDSHYYDDDDDASTFVREVERGIEEDPTDSKKSEAFKILKKSLKERGKVNRKSGDSSGTCPKGTIPANGGYVLISSSDCIPNYTSPVAFDESIINRKVSPCKSFSEFACSGWKGNQGRSFTYSSSSNKKVLRMVENLDAIGDKLNWGQDKKVEDRDGQISESVSTERSIFSTFVQECHSAINDIPDSLEKVGNHWLLDRLITMINSQKGNWRTLGSHFGISTCMGSNPLFHIRAETDMFDNRKPLFYVQPKGFVGMESNIRKRSFYIMDSCEHLYSNYIENSNDKNKEEDSCLRDIEDLEQTLLDYFKLSMEEMNRHSKDDSFEDFFTDGKKEADKRKSIHDASPFFRGEFFLGFTEGLVRCVSSNETKSLDPEDIFIWTEYSDFFDQLDTLTNGEKETFDKMKLMLMISLISDQLEVIGFFAAGDYDHVVDNGKFPIDNKDHFRDIPPLKSRLLHIPTPYYDEFSENNPRLKRLSGVHSKIRVQNLRKIFQYDGEGFEKEPFSLSPNPEWLNYAWFTCIDIAEAYMPEIVDNSFASFTTTVEDRANIAHLIDTLLESLVNDMKTSDMLDDATKESLTDKTNNILKRIVVPWETNIEAELEEQRLGRRSLRYPIPVDHTQIGISGNDFYGDTVLLRRWAVRAEVEDYIKRLDPKNNMKRFGENNLVFGMSTSQTNAYYSPLENNINILAGIVHPPFFHKDYTVTSKYATMGAIIGHELSHSLDKTGVLFDKYGNLNTSILSADARAKYEKREDCFFQQYSKYKTVLGNVVDAEKTISENIADNAGLQASWDAMKKIISDKSEEEITQKELSRIAKEFTLSYAQIWCTNREPEEEKRIMDMDVHSPAQVRIDRTLSNLIDKDTGKYVMNIAWGCKNEDTMINKKRCAVF